MRVRSFVSVSLLLLASVAAAPLARADDVSLSDLTFSRDKTNVRIKSVVASGTNLTRDELAKIFDPNTPREVSAALTAKMKATRVSVPEIATSGDDYTATLRDLVLADVDAGKVATLTLGGVDGKANERKVGEVSFKSNALEMHGLDLSRVAESLGSAGAPNPTMRVASISYKGFEASFPDTETPADAPGGNVVKVSLASISGTNAYDGDVPTKSAGRADHFVVVVPKASKYAATLASFGLDKIDVGLTVAGSYDKATKTYALEDYTINGLGAGSIGVTGRVGIDPTFFSSDPKERMARLMNVAIVNVALNYKDAGLFSHALAFIAKQQGKSVDDLKREWTMMATQMIPVLLGGDPSSLKLAEALGKFITTPKSLTVSATAKGEPPKVSELSRITDPKALLSRVDIGASAGQ